MYFQCQNTHNTCLSSLFLNSRMLLMRTMLKQKQGIKALTDTDPPQKKKEKKRYER